LLFSVATPTLSSSIYTLSLHDALPIFGINMAAFQQKFADSCVIVFCRGTNQQGSYLPFFAVCRQLAHRFLPVIENLLTVSNHNRSEEHTSELQSRVDLVCRLLLEKKNS